jgi:hypothetical protein
MIKVVQTTVLARATASQTVVVNFPEFPLRANEVDTVRAGLRTFLTRTDVGQLSVDGLQLFRKEPPPTLTQDERLRVRLRLHVPVPSWEKERVTRTLEEKLARERSSWAGGYTGLPILAVEESVFGQDLAPHLETILASESAFSGAIAMFPVVTPDELGVPHGLENVAFKFRDGTAALDVGLETFGDNVQSWSAGYALAMHVPSSVREEWDIVRRESGNVVHLRRPASLNRSYSRVPYTDPTKPAKDDALVQRLVDASIALAAWDEEAR